MTLHVRTEPWQDVMSQVCHSHPVWFNLHLKVDDRGFKNRISNEIQTRETTNKQIVHLLCSVRSWKSNRKWVFMSWTELQLNIYSAPSSLWYHGSVLLLFFLFFLFYRLIVSQLPEIGLKVKKVFSHCERREGGSVGSGPRNLSHLILRLYVGIWVFTYLTDTNFCLTKSQFKRFLPRDT